MKNTSGHFLNLYYPQPTDDNNLPSNPPLSYVYLHYEFVDCEIDTEKNKMKWEKHREVWSVQSITNVAISNGCIRCSIKEP